jgi:menaquinone-9 beta-reductase
MISIRYSHPVDCDVLVVGGGPAGSTLAYHLAMAGVKVMVVEAEKFPRDKVCGDGVSSISVAELERLGITALPSFTSTNEVHRVGLFLEEDFVTINLAKTPKSPYHARIVPRILLDNWMYEAASRNGASYLENTRLTHFTVHDGYVRAEVKQGSREHTLKAKMIVGADGSSSTVSRIIHGKKPDNAFRLLGLRAYYHGIEGPADQVDVYFSKDNFPGIYWTFPVGTQGANVGLAMVAKTIPDQTSHAKDLLLNHIEHNPHMRNRIGNGKLEGRVMGWPLTFYNRQSKLAGERWLLVGDAAGLINPLSGDGIQYAILSGRWAAEAILSGAGQRDFIHFPQQAYAAKVHRELAYDYALSSMLIQFGRNKALTGVGMEFMKVCIARAKVDPSYASIIAGIFEGSYPSYKALELKFLLKSLLQTTRHVGGVTGESLLQGPDGWLQASQDLQKNTLRMLELMQANPDGQIDWAKDMATQLFQVAKHLVGHIGRRII